MKTTIVTKTIIVGAMEIAIAMISVIVMMIADVYLTTIHVMILGLHPTKLSYEII